jgi:hypothetical protein
MKLDAPAKQKLRALCRGRSKADLKLLFALARANTDRALFAAIAPPQKPSRPGDPLVREIEKTLRPILGPAAEKGEWLIAHMAKKHRRKLDFAPKGVAAAVRWLRRDFKDAQIRAGARGLIRELDALYAPRETVV